MDNVHTFRIGVPRTAFEPGRIPHVFAGLQCLQGLESGSSPTSGTTDRLVRGDFALTCVQSLRSRRLTVWVAGFSLAAAGPVQVYGVAVQVPGWWAFRLLKWAIWFLVPVLLGWPAWPTPVHVSGKRGRHDFGDLAYGRPWEAVLGVPARVAAPKFVLPKRVWTVSTLTSALLEGRKVSAMAGSTALIPQSCGART
ncbi:hypothetical protein QF031_002075 [Pseudarthrobacter defluvii]|nr:hypothetical protein [Pseudarthrobacter defluvii]